MGYTASPQLLVEAGRIRLRQGVALGYNPPDFFRDGSVRSEVSMDPASLRENRQGSGMVRVQQLGADGAWQFAYSPRLAQRKPAPSGWHPDWGATNHQHRALLAFAPRWGESLSAQGLLHLRQGHSAQWGLNLSGLVDQATVAHLEWAAGQARTQWHEALDLPDPQRWRHRLAAGATHHPPQTHADGRTALQRHGPRAQRLAGPARRAAARLPAVPCLELAGPGAPHTLGAVLPCHLERCAHARPGPQQPVAPGPGGRQPPLLAGSPVPGQGVRCGAAMAAQPWHSTEPVWPVARSKAVGAQRAALFLTVYDLVRPPATPCARSCWRAVHRGYPGTRCCHGP